MELNKGVLNIRVRFGKDERMQIISTVCQVNRAIYDAMQKADKAVNVHVLKWPGVDIGEDQVDPLRDVRVLQVLEGVKMAHYCITVGSFDLGLRPLFWRMATNTLGQFLIADSWRTVHVYDNNGMFQFSFNPQTDDAKTEIQKIYDLVTEDVSENIYLLVRLRRPWPNGWDEEVQVFNKNANLEYKFPVRYALMNRLLVSGSKLLILSSWEADVYNQNGDFVRSFEFFKSGGDRALTNCTATHDGHILIMHDKGGYSDFFSVYVFTAEGQEIAKFKSGVGFGLDFMHFSPRSAGEHVVIAGYDGEYGIIVVEIYTLDGNFVRRILLRDEPKLQFKGITVTMKEHIAVGFTGCNGYCKVVVY